MLKREREREYYKRKVLYSFRMMFQNASVYTTMNKQSDHLISSESVRDHHIEKKSMTMRGPGRNYRRRLLFTLIYAGLRGCSRTGLQKTESHLATGR